MARILICHADDGADLATELGARLARLGHTIVSSAATAGGPRSALSMVGGADVTVVIWTEQSIGSEAIRDLAANALLLGRLISILPDGMQADLVPSHFRGVRAARIADTESICRAIDTLTVPSVQDSVVSARPKGIGSSESVRLQRFERPPGANEPLSRPVGVGSGTSQPRERPSHRKDASEGALEVEAGRLVHKIPERMWLGVPETLEVRLGRLEARDLAEGLAGRGGLTEQDIPIVETMSVSLYCKDRAFSIESQSDLTQLVMNDLTRGTALEGEDFGRWVWLVTPQTIGEQPLFVKVTAALKDRRGVPTTSRLPDREFKVRVSVHAAKSTASILGRVMPRLLIAAAAGIVAAISRDIWWPKLHALLVGVGWLS